MSKAILNWSSHVSDRAFRVLMLMAVTAKDNGSKEVPAAVYFGGHEYLARALASGKGADQKSLLRTVRRAVDELEEVGAITCTSRAHLGSHAVYKLTLSATPIPRQRSNAESTHFTNREDTECPTTQDTECPTTQDNPCPTRQDNPCPTYKEPLEEPLEELEEEERVCLRTDVAEVAPNAASKKPDDLPPRCREPTCARGFVLIGDQISHCPNCHPNVIELRRSA